jgi:signal transduction histidine kinase
MYMVQSGRIAIFKGDWDEPTLLAHRGANESIGEMALIENLPRSATAVALEPCLCHRIDREQFRQWLQRNTVSGLAMLKTLSGRLREADQARNFNAHLEQQLLGKLNELKTQQERLLETQRLREELADLIVHDLRNPLSTIAGTLDLIRVILPPELLEQHAPLFEAAALSVDRLVRLTNTMLEVSRLEAGEMPLQISPVVIPDLLAEIAHRLGPLAQQEHVQLELQISPNIPTLMADMDLLDRVVTNLLDNAFKYAPEASTVMVAAQRRDDNLLISVTDRGPGIPPHQREQVFERFGQVDSERPKRRGFGLGLVFCRLVVEAHHGSLWLEEGDNQRGCKFVFTLPLNAPPLDP